nr:unnamed protein product [Digitaria exilis]
MKLSATRSRLSGAAPASDTVWQEQRRPRARGHEQASTRTPPSPWRLLLAALLLFAGGAAGCLPLLSLLCVVASIVGFSFDLFDSALIWHRFVQFPFSVCSISAAACWMYLRFV